MTPGEEKVYEYRKNPKSSDTRKIAVIILKLERYSFTVQ